MLRQYRVLNVFVCCTVLQIIVIDSGPDTIDFNLCQNRIHSQTQTHTQYRQTE